MAASRSGRSGGRSGSDPDQAFTFEGSAASHGSRLHSRRNSVTSTVLMPPRPPLFGMMLASAHADVAAGTRLGSQSTWGRAWGLMS